MAQSLQILTQTRFSADDWKNLPFTISELKVVYDYTHNREALILQCINTAPLSIRSIYFDLDCFDDAGDLLGKANGLCIRGLDAKPNSEFGSESPVVIPYSGTCKVNLTIQKVVFCDNSVWRAGEPLPVATEAAPAPEEPTVASTPVAEQAPVQDPPRPEPIPTEWQNPEPTIEGYRTAIRGLSTSDHPNAPYLIKKFSALVEKLEAEAAETAQKEAAAAKAAEQAARYSALLATKPDTIDGWQKLADDWKSMGAYKDAPQRAANALKKVKSIKTSAKHLAEKEAEAARIAAAQKAATRKTAIKATIAIGSTVAVITALVLLFVFVLIPASKQVAYEDAEELYANGKYCEAILLFEELGNYSDSQERIRKIKFELTGNEDALFETAEQSPWYSIQNGVLSYDSENYKTELKELRIPDYFDNQKVVQIGSSFFSTMTTLQKVILPPSVVAIGESAFDGCTSLTTVEAPGLIYAGKYLFRGCISLTEITLPVSLTTLGDGAFQGCTSLKKVVLPEGLRTLSNSIFLGCSSLTDIQFSSKLIEVDDYAFANCTSLTALSFPDTLTTIGNNAFLSCVKLSKINLPDTLTAIGDKAFGHCSSLTSLNPGNNLEKVSASTFTGCTALKEITLPAGLTTIGRNAFEDCKALTTVYYLGSQTQWESINLQAGNQCLTDAKIEYKG